MLANLKSRLSAFPPQVWILLLTLLCLAPFLNKAIHTDDTLFVRAAEQIQKHPADFYGFDLNWFGKTRPMIDNFNNPPLACYYMALVASVAGWSEPFLHLAFAATAIIALLGIFALAKRHCSQPFTAVSVALLTPVFLISTTTLMCDVLLLAFWIWALVFFERGLGEDNATWFLAAGFLAGMAAMSKFIGVGLIPLMAVYALLRKRGAGWWLIALAVPLLLTGLCEWAIYSLYGKGVFLTAARAAARAVAHGGSFVERGIVGLSFLGGCYLPLLLLVPFLWSAKKIAPALCLMLPCLLAFPRLGKYALLWGHDADPNWLLFAQSTLFLMAGMHVLLLAASDLWRRRSAFSVLLLLWVFSIFFFAICLNRTLNGYTFLPMLPAVGILAARRLEEELTSASIARRRWLPWLALPALTLGMLVLKADYDLATISRVAAKEVCAKYESPGKTLWFEGHWGFQYYMEKYGAKALERGFAQPNKGDTVVVPAEALNTFDISADFVRLVETFEYRPNMLCSTMSLSAGAGFYGATAGPFPFSVGRPDVEQYYVFEVVRSREEAIKAPGERAKVGAISEQFALERMAEHCAAEIRRNPDNLFAYFQLGLFLASRGKTVEAEKQFTEVLRIDPNNARAHIELATLLARQKNRATALSHYRAALRLMPESSCEREALVLFLEESQDL